MVAPKPAPKWWIEKKQQEAERAKLAVPTRSALRRMWTELGCKKRAWLVHEEKRHQARLAKATLRLEKARAAADVASTQLVNFVAKGRNHTHLLDHVAAAANQSSVDAHNQRIADEAAARAKAAGGCVVAGCPLAQTDFTRLVEYAHIAGLGKVDAVTKLRGAAADAEMKKTRRLCIFHHQVETSDERGWTRQSDLSGVRLQLAKYKVARGCEHPHHAEMNYAPLMQTVDPELLHSFLERSCVLRDCTFSKAERAKLDDEGLAALRLQELKSGTGVVHCLLCHSLYTLCEEAALMHRTGISKAQYQLLKEQSPNFVAHFESVTAGFDWKAERERLSAIAAANARNRHDRQRNGVEDEKEMDE